MYVYLQPSTKFRTIKENSKFKVNHCLAYYKGLEDSVIKNMLKVIYALLVLGEGGMDFDSDEEYINQENIM